MGKRLTGASARLHARLLRRTGTTPQRYRWKPRLAALVLRRAAPARTTPTSSRGPIFPLKPPSPRRVGPSRTAVALALLRRTGASTNAALRRTGASTNAAVRRTGASTNAALQSSVRTAGPALAAGWRAFARATKVAAIAIWAWAGVALSAIAQVLVTLGRRFAIIARAIGSALAAGGRWLARMAGRLPTISLRAVILAATAIVTVGASVAVISVFIAELSAATSAEEGPNPGPNGPVGVPDLDPIEMTPAARIGDPVSFTLVAGGDIITHANVKWAARSGSSYDFGPLLAGVDPWVEGADIAICNMEIPIDGGGPLSDTGGVSPVMVAPPAIVSALSAHGWDGCSTATNHSLDGGWSSVVQTLDTFEANHLGAVGTARNPDEAALPQIYVIRDGIREIHVAHLSYTWATNSIPKPAGKPWSVNTFSRFEPDVSGILAQAEAARAAGADVVIASIHCCQEFTTEPTETQLAIADQIAASGLVDLVIGHHAHVPQPIKKLPGGPDGNGMWVAYGLGNFLTGMDTACCYVGTENGLLITATFTVQVNGRVDVGMEWSAITVDRAAGYRIERLTGTEGAVGSLSAKEVAARYARVRAAVGDEATELIEPAQPLAESVTLIERRTEPTST